MSNDRTTALTENEKYKFCVDTLKLKEDLEANYLDICARLYKIKNERYFEAGWSSWEEFGWEFKVSGSTVNRMARIHELLVEKYGIERDRLVAAGGWTVLSELLPVIREDMPRDKVEEIIDTVVTEKREGVRLLVKDLKRGKPCKHEHVRRVTLDICTDCNERWTIHDETDSKS